MKKVLSLLAVLLLCAATIAFGIEGWPRVQESLDVAVNTVTRITSTTYLPGGTGSPILPVLIQTNGTGYYRLDPFDSIAATNFTPDANDYRCASGDIIEVAYAQYFRITPATTAFSAPVTSFGR